MKINKKWLEDKSACIEGYEWSIKKLGSDSIDCIDFIKLLMENDKYQWANWVIVRIFTKKQNVQYAVFSAEQVISIYENKYPDDKRISNAINVAKVLLNNPNKETAADAATAYASASYAADAATAYASASYAADAATAYASAASTYSTACAASIYANSYADNAPAFTYATAVTAYASASYAADAATAYGDAARKEIIIKILNYGISLIKGNSND